MNPYDENNKTYRALMHLGQQLVLGARDRDNDAISSTCDEIFDLVCQIVER